MATVFFLCISIFAVLFNDASGVEKGKKESWKKPTVQVLMTKCDVKGSKLELEILYLNSVKRQDVTMCYIKTGEKNCTSFEECVQTSGQLMNSVKCVTFDQSNKNAYDLRLKFGKNDTSTIVMNHFIPSRYRLQCVGGWPTSGFGPGLGYRYTGSMINYAVVEKTPYTMTIQANLSRGIFSTIRFVDIKLKSDDIYPLMAHCNISNTDPKASTCHFEGLHRCTRYKICIKMYTTSYRRVETCFKENSGYVAPVAPSNFAGFSLAGYDGYYSKSILKWDPIKNFDQQFDKYYVAYYEKGDFQKDKTRDSGMIVKADLNRPVALKYCSRCGCSRTVQKNIFRLNNQNIVSSLWDQVEKWQERDIKRQNMWTGVMGGIGGGFFVALIVAAVYIRNKRKRSSESNSLLASSKRVTYSKFGSETEQSPL